MRGMYTGFAAGKVIAGVPHVRRHESWIRLGAVARWQAESKG